MVGLGRREPKTRLVTFYPEAAALALWARGAPPGWRERWVPEG